MPLPLTVSCSSKIQIGFTFLVLAHPGSPGQKAVKQVCVCVCACACVCNIAKYNSWPLVNVLSCDNTSSHFCTIGCSFGQINISGCDLCDTYSADWSDESRAWFNWLLYTSWSPHSTVVAQDALSYEGNLLRFHDTQGAWGNQITPSSKYQPVLKFS